MKPPDLNLLVTLDVLLTEGSVAKAARRLQLSPSAMSRALGRLREAVGDPLLVRAGRGLVPTPRAAELRERVGPLVDQAVAALSPAEDLDLARLERSFTLRSREGFVETYGPALIERVAAGAPGVRLRFTVKEDREKGPLREGSADLETGVVGPNTGNEMRTQLLFRDRLIGVVREAHELAHGKVTAERYAAGRHVLVSRRGRDRDRIDEALEALGLEREIAVIVSGFSAGLALARTTDLIATVPARHSGRLRYAMHSFELPVATPEIPISLLWHPRMDADPAHRWLRGCVREVCSDPSL